MNMAMVTNKPNPQLQEMSKELKNIAFWLGSILPTKPLFTESSFTFCITDDHEKSKYEPLQSRLYWARHPKAPSDVAGING